MKQWNLRSPEVANLLNPAFCGRILYKAVEAHIQANGQPMPYVLSFVLLPLVLHRITRETLDARNRQFQLWLNQNQQAKIGFADRARQIVPYVREAVAFLLQTNSLTLHVNGGLTVASPLRRMRRTAGEVPENEECVKKAAILGKWFASGGPAATVYASLGVKP